MSDPLEDAWDIVQLDGVTAHKIHLNGDPGRPQGVVIRVRDTTYQVDDRVRLVLPGVWEAYGPPGVEFRDGEAGWMAAYAPDGHDVQLVTEDVPGRVGWLRFRAMPGEHDGGRAK